MHSNSAFAAVWLLSVLGANAAPRAQTAGACSGQSCYVAALASSTEEPYALKNGRKPTGGNASGDSCIKRHYKELGLPPPAGLKYALGLAEDFDLDLASVTGAMADQASEHLKDRRSELEHSLESKVSRVMERRMADIEAEKEAEVIEQEEIEVSEDGTVLEKRQGACKNNILLFGRGTTELGTMGATVGPALSTAVGKGWQVEGINYSADLPGIYCLGMTGGMKCVKQLESLVSRCPKSNYVLSGYSQGAMVARICAAHVNEKARAQIKGLALFGDPFNGASVKGIPKEKVKTWCALGDGVCRGEFTITAAHLSYGGSVSAAAKWINSVVTK